MRRDASPLDRNLPVFQPAKPPYKRLGYFAETLDELRAKFPEHGEAAANDARWFAVSIWLLKGEYRHSGLSNPEPVASVAVDLCRSHNMATSGIPHHAGKEWIDAFNGLTPESQCEAVRVAEETIKDWERAGQPRLTSELIRRTQQYTHSCLKLLTPESVCQNQEIPA
jgi:hypothetical protein